MHPVKGLISFIYVYSTEWIKTSYTLSLIFLTLIPTNLLSFVVQEKKSKKRKEKSKQKGKKSSLVVNQQKYGKYGILMESDMFNKQQEFYLWLQEVKQVNPEVIPRFEMKKMFDSYAEDYNTVTLPHKK